MGRGGSCILTGSPTWAAAKLFMDILSGFGILFLKADFLFLKILTS